MGSGSRKIVIGLISILSLGAIGFYLLLPIVAPKVISTLITSLGASFVSISEFSLGLGKIQIAHSEVVWDSATVKTETKIEHLDIGFDFATLLNLHPNLLSAARLEVNLTQKNAVDSKSDPDPSFNQKPFLEVLYNFSLPADQITVKDFALKLSSVNGPPILQINTALNATEEKLSIVSGGSIHYTDLGYDLLLNLSSNLDLTKSDNANQFNIQKFETTLSASSPTISLKNGIFSGNNLSLNEDGLSADLDLKGELDYVIPVTNLQSRFSVRPDKKVQLLPLLEIHTLSADLLGGKAEFLPFKFAPASKTNKFTVKISGISLQELLKRYPQEKLFGTGILDGQFPLTFSGANISMSAGVVSARAPGGTLKCDLSDWATSAGENAGVKFAAMALSNFNYSELKATTAYNSTGDLNLAVSLIGANPDMNENQPVHVNLNIADNIPALLKTMRLIKDGPELVTAEVRKKH